LKSTLSMISIATPACLWGPLLGRSSSSVSPSVSAHLSIYTCVYIIFLPYSPSYSISFYPTPLTSTSSPDRTYLTLLFSVLQKIIFVCLRQLYREFRNKIHIQYEIIHMYMKYTHVYI
jgi:hypothetical protein